MLPAFPFHSGKLFHKRNLSGHRQDRLYQSGGVSTVDFLRVHIPLPSWNATPTSIHSLRPQCKVCIGSPQAEPKSLLVDDVHLHEARQVPRYARRFATALRRWCLRSSSTALERSDNRNVPIMQDPPSEKTRLYSPPVQSSPPLHCRPRGPGGCGQAKIAGRTAPRPVRPRCKSAIVTSAQLVTTCEPVLCTAGRTSTDPCRPVNLRGWHDLPVLALNFQVEA